MNNTIEFTEVFGYNVFELRGLILLTQLNANLRCMKGKF